MELAEIGWPDDSITYDEYLADFNADFHDLRRAAAFRSCLSPTSYRASQALAEVLLERGSLGVVYPSVRRRGGTCVACLVVWSALIWPPVSDRSKACTSSRARVQQ